MHMAWPTKMTRFSNILRHNKLTVKKDEHKNQENKLSHHMVSLKNTQQNTSNQT